MHPVCHLVDEICSHFLGWALSQSNTMIVAPPKCGMAAGVGLRILDTVKKALRGCVN